MRRAASTVAPTTVHTIRRASLDRLPLPRRRPATPEFVQIALAQATLTEAVTVPLPRPKPVVTGFAGAKPPAAVQPPRRRAAERDWHKLRPASSRG